MILRRNHQTGVERDSLICGPMQLAFLLMVGVWSADLVRVTHWRLCLLIILGFIVSRLMDQRRWGRVADVILWGSLLLVGNLAASLRLHQTVANDIGELLSTPIDVPIVVTGSVAGLPAERTRRESLSVWNQINETEPTAEDIQTTFLADLTTIAASDGPVDASGIVRVFVSGQCPDIRWGDQIQITGRFDGGQLPENPGEFDYGQLLDRQGISGAIYVRHSMAVRRLAPVADWAPKKLLTDFREEAVFLLKAHLSKDAAPLAEALLLGNRGHLSPQMEREYIATGTMHLLAISGLHVGILYVFLIRLFHVLMLPGNRAMALAAAVCFAYAVLTDLRPSVMRSAIFIVLVVVAQIWNRRLRMQVLIGNVAVILILLDPGIVYDIGAWLSFVAVGALGWVSHLSPVKQEHSTLPLTDFTLTERLTRWTAYLKRESARHARQMAAVTCLSGPIVATQFHVVSVISFAANAILIPLTAVAMVLGFVFIGMGMVLPESTLLFSKPLELSLWVMNEVVSAAASVPFGWLSLPDFPPWYCPVYYLVLTLAALSSISAIRRVAWTGVAFMILGGLGLGLAAPVHQDLRMTVLSVGHGNAVVMEAPDGRVMLFDSGALRRSERAADLICRFLWSRGHRQIDGLIISHADMDHYNALPGILGRMPVGAVYTSRDFARTGTDSINWLLRHAHKSGSRLTLANDGDRASFGGVNVRFLQADHESDWTDNERSLVAIVEFAGRTICLPGDLEGRGQELLLKRIPEVNVLVSPHHGSPAANPETMFEALKPQTVIVSGDDIDHLEALQSKAGDATEVLHTGESGAITICIEESGSRIQVFSHLPRLTVLPGFANSN
ncbi:MAG: ComEC/Rec2 family competence protein [Planctomyces sp.]|nr:ComEC/Rec2 family competence protein [Planctomyces sp.]